MLLLAVGPFSRVVIGCWSVESCCYWLLVRLVVLLLAVKSGVRLFVKFLLFVVN